MNKIRLGIDSGTTTDQYNALHREFDIKFNPSVASYGKEIEINIDAFLLMDGDIHKYSSEIIQYCSLYNIPVMGFNRFDKSLQSLYLNHFKIPYPATYFYYQDNTVKMSANNLLSVLCELEDYDKIVVKMCQGARGLGQMLTCKKDLINLMCEPIPNAKYINDYEIEDKEKPKEIPPIDTEKYKLGNGGWCHHLKDRLCSATDFIVQKYEEVVEEYRLLFFYGEEPIAIQREVGKNGNWQANSCITGFSKEVDYNIIDEDLLNKINDLGLYIKTPFMSTDVYKTKEGVWGIFEFQMEFGFKDVPPTKLCKKMNNSIKNLYNKLK